MRLTLEQNGLADHSGIRVEHRSPQSIAEYRQGRTANNVFFDGDDSSRVAPHSEPTHWYAGYESQSDNLLNVDSAVSGGQTIDFWTWYFIEEGWDYAYVEALVGVCPVSSTPRVRK